MRGTKMFAPLWRSDVLFERVIEAGFLSDEELHIFHQLTRERRSLPLYLGGFWRCYECEFESSELTAMGAHILQRHQAVTVQTRKYSFSTIDNAADTAVV